MSTENQMHTKIRPLHTFSILLLAAWSMTCLERRSGPGTSDTKPAEKKNADGSAHSKGEKTDVKASSEEPAETGPAKLVVQIRSVEGRPLGSTVITVGKSTAKTDGSGRAVISIDGGEYVLRADLPGYAEVVRPVRLQAGRTNPVVLLMAPTKTYALTSLSTEQAIHEPGMDLIIPAGTLETASGTPAKSGVIEIRALDLKTELHAMPGDFRGTLADGKQVAIESFGVASIHARDSVGGKDLRIRKGAAMTLRLKMQGRHPKPAAWSMDEKTGIWRYEGEAKVLSSGAAAEIVLPHLSWWNIDAPMTDHASIWVKSFVDERGTFLFTPQIGARGLDYNGISYPYDYYNKQSLRVPGRCVDVKLGSRLEFSADYFDDGGIYEYRGEMRAKDKVSSCKVNPDDGIVIPQMKLERVPVTCVRGRIELDGASAGSQRIEVYEESSTGRSEGRFERPLFVGALKGGAFCVDNVPVNRQSWVYVFSGVNRKLEECDREQYGAFPVRAAKTDQAGKCVTDSRACVDVGTLRGRLDQSRCMGDAKLTLGR